MNKVDLSKIDITRKIRSLEDIFEDPAAEVLLKSESELNKMIKFVKDGKKYDVELNGENYGSLEFNEERKTWVLWPKDIDDGIDYFESLEETQAAIKDELTK